VARAPQVRKTRQKPPCIELRTTALCEDDRQYERERCGRRYPVHGGSPSPSGEITHAQNCAHAEPCGRGSMARSSRSAESAMIVPGEEWCGPASLAGHSGDSV
jgi:hypothetical protein